MSRFQQSPHLRPAQCSLSKINHATELINTRTIELDRLSAVFLELWTIPGHIKLNMQPTKLKILGLDPPPQEWREADFRLQLFSLNLPNQALAFRYKHRSSNLHPIPFEFVEGSLRLQDLAHLLIYHGPEALATKVVLQPHVAPRH